MIRTLTIGILLSTVAQADIKDDLAKVVASQNRRVEVVQRVTPTVVCVFDEDRLGGGSGVIIDPRGYGLTNYHVVMKFMNTRVGVGGLSDGKLYRLEVLGVDITGDVAMFKLEGKDTYEYAELGDSDTVRVGDDVIAMGNPFTLAEDYSPTVSTGLVTGTNRWQGEGDTLVYTDCIQIDAAINPGNSGGPLFDSNGKVIGINGRISTEMHKYARGRYNVGLGYAISINQIKRYLPTLRAGNLGVHGTLHATTRDFIDEVIFNDVIPDASAWNAGIRVEHQLLRFGDVDIHSANQFASIIGTYPTGWPVPVTYSASGRVFHKVVRLDPAPPPLRGEYVAPQEHNQSAIIETLDAFRTAVHQTDDPPTTWSWKVTRTTDTGQSSTFAISDNDNKYTRTETAPDGSTVRAIHLAHDDAFWTEHDRQFTLSTDQTMLYRATRALRRAFLTDKSLADKEETTHQGSDALITIDDAGHIERERRLQTIQWKPDDDLTIAVGFELDSSLPARVVVEDRPTQQSLEIILDDYREKSGVTWPYAMTVSSKTLNFTETITDLEVTR